MNEYDKKLVTVMAHAFNTWFTEQCSGEAEQSKAFIDYGLEIMEMPANSPTAVLWYGFVGGFGEGVKFMSVEQIDAE